MQHIPIKQAVVEENEQLQARVQVLEETLDAIRSGGADAVVVSGPKGDQVFTLSGALEPYRVMVETMSEGAISLAQGGIILYCNNRFAEMIKTPQEMIIGAPLSRWITTQDRARLDAMLERSRSWVVREELTLLAGDSTPLPTMFSMCPMPGNIGNLAVAVITDMTSFIAANEAEARLARIVESSNDAIISTTLDDVVQSWNTAAEHLLGYQREEVIGQILHKLIVPVDRSHEVAEKLASVQRGETFGNSDTVRLRKDGTAVHVSLSAAPIKRQDGTIFGIALILHDITERKLAEQRMHIAAIAFEAQEGMFITDANGVILQVNRAFTEISGYSAEELVGHTPRIFRSGRHGPEFYAAMREAITRTGSWRGEIWNRKRSGDLYAAWLTVTVVRSQADQPTHYVATVNDISERKAAEEQIKSLAFFDPLTSLPNRRLLLYRLEQALAASSRTHGVGALLFIDLDNFKTLNDTRGHDQGDQLLQEVSRRLTSCVRDGDTVARLGGDEFVVMLENLEQNMAEAANQTEAVGEQIRLSLNQPYVLADGQYHNTCSIGITMFANHQQTIEQLLKRADLAMYQAKSAGRNLVRFFEPEMQTAVNKRAELEAELHSGLREQQFLLHFQPQVGDDGRLIGMEALLRWKNPGRGLVLPYAFIDLAEETGLIVPLGLWILETACQQMVAWGDRPELADLIMSINVSPRQFHQREFVEKMLSILDRTGVNAQRIMLELTESILIHDIDDVISKMNVLKKRGISFSLDDFGTGYSSLYYLKRLPINQLKIDQRFVENILTDNNDSSISRTIVALANSLDLEVIAEGVENQAQLELLRHQDCHAFQGFLFSQALPAKEFESFAGAYPGNCPALSTPAT